jgi:GTPase Era involved in 16S rRNA processing
LTNLKELCSVIIRISQEINCPEANRVSKAVLDALDRQTFHVVVLGEFNRGKSSLINSLLDFDILPCDVLPTTATINVIEFAQDNECYITWQDGRVDKLMLDQNYLAKFSVDGGYDAQQVKYLIIKVNNPVLKDGLIFIDTPGVNDICESRMDVTYQILPNCDAALFLLDAVAPLTRSEADFLTTKVFAYKIDDILFVLSKADRLDEEELTEALDGANARLKHVLKKDVNIIPYSAKQVSHGAYDYKQKFFEALVELRKDAMNKKEKRLSLQLSLAANIITDNLIMIQNLLNIRTI